MLLAALSNSCKKEVTEPAYIYLDKATFSAKAGEGTSEQNIQYAGIYIEDQIQGIYQLPAHVPVISSGSKRVDIRAFIKRLAKESYIANPVFTTYTTQINFESLKTDTLRPLFEYRDDTEFVYLENFNGAGNSLKIRSRYNLGDTAYVENSSASFDGSNYLKLRLQAGESKIELETQDEYQLPVDGREVLMELHYKCNVPFTLGFAMRESTQQIDIPLVSPYPTNGEWRKGYISLKDDLTGKVNALAFKILIGCFNAEPGVAPEILIDNIKVVHRD